MQFNQMNPPCYGYNNCGPDIEFNRRGRKSIPLHPAAGAHEYLHKNFESMLLHQAPHLETQEIIGEGEVTSLVYSNGLIQYFFVPIPQRGSLNLNNSTGSHNIAAWRVRSIDTPFYGYNNCGPQNQFNRQIIGEGDVTPLVYPDGSIQYFFIPTSWCMQNNNSINNINPSLTTPNVAAWLVRRINNPQPPPGCQVSQRTFEVPLERQSYSDISKIDATFKLKFHNDGWTSTTDLIYFYPSLRSSTETQHKGNSAVQVESPPWTICNCEAVRLPCSCHKETKICSEHMRNEVVTSMSIDDVRSKYESEEKKAPQQYRKCCCNGMRNRSKRNVTCQCDDLPKPNTKNKMVFTFADQGSNCLDKSEQPTQTFKSTSSSTLRIGKDNIQTELWMPKSSIAKKSMKSKPSEKSLNTCSSDCSCHESN